MVYYSDMLKNGERVPKYVIIEKLIIKWQPKNENAKIRHI